MNEKERIDFLNLQARVVICEGKLEKKKLRIERIKEIRKISHECPISAEYALILLRELCDAILGEKGQL